MSKCKICEQRKINSIKNQERNESFYLEGREVGFGDGYKIAMQKVREAIIKRRDNIIRRCKNEEIKFYQTVLLNDLLKELGLDDGK
jgi:hypothetical protein